jgi:S1-C subfamily serine protease
MANKVIIGILVLLVVISGGIGYYSYTLNQQINRLDERLTSFEMEQSVRVEALSNELASLRTETQAGIGYMKEQLADAKNDIGDLRAELKSAGERITGIEEETGAINSQLQSLDERVSNAEDIISRTMVDANKVYEEVGRATVRITNGQATIGSGFIYDNDSHVVTAYHVVENLTRIFIMMDDGQVSQATTMGYCEFSDVAVLKLVSNPGITPPVIGDSSLLRVGEPVIAIGSPGDGDSPLGLRDTLTAGILSQVNRFIDVEGRWVANMLQFDAPINFGNSGCPLSNSAGEIIGLVTARIDPLRGDGIYFAVASNKFKRVVEAILDSGSFAYPWIGTGIADLTPQDVQDMSLETTNGILVTAIFANSPADLAGILTDDVIVAVDGMPVKDTGELTSYLGEYKSPGDEITIDIIRGSGSIQITLEVGERQQ